ncbi:serpentine type 7TM GPCR chemoreceptor str domain-containing protein [Ditylenchus destructor]|uniref:Serpentine type 7TM GPCR chemoreceptor str domain-containing protein n=1 Tax=Ditylenchus destructor TaxID=166010 RepID=A0AAD4MHY4_9BILA|nr:serpentine type 7TM GPCR chemoreceptor str domain-containing protein [Ditylenchus destructor]
MQFVYRYLLLCRNITISYYVYLALIVIPGIFCVVWMNLIFNFTSGRPPPTKRLFRDSEFYFLLCESTEQEFVEVSVTDAKGNILCIVGCLTMNFAFYLIIFISSLRIMAFLNSQKDRVNSEFFKQAEHQMNYILAAQQSMENIPHTFIGYSPLFLLTTLLIFATFVIRVLFILGQYRKKPFKVCRCSTINLSSDTLHDILAFFDRKSLSRQRSVDSRFNRTIQQEFVNKPYLVLEKYTKEKRVYGTGRCIANVEMVNNILVEKFVRFKHADVECNDRDRVSHLLSTSEPWQTFDLRLTTEFKLTKYNARRLAKCKKVNSISFSGRLTLLPELLLGNCPHLKISDGLFKTADSASVPWTKILDFLFRESESYHRRNFLEIKTRNPPSAEEYLQFIDAMKQRFTTVTTRLIFDFYWRTNNAPVFRIDEKVENVHHHGMLNLKQTNYYYNDRNDSTIHLYAL